jgi:hypothetical protein
VEKSSSPPARFRFDELRKASTMKNQTPEQIERRRKIARETATRAVARMRAEGAERDHDLKEGGDNLISDEDLEIAERAVDNAAIRGGKPKT